MVKFPCEITPQPKPINYLAHAYLSFNDPEIIVGNLISDFVKGKKKLLYPIGIQHGITLHRAIDTFTDTHPVTKMAKEIFRPDYRLYSGAIMDVVYDHFLATDENEFSENSLLSFSLQTYSVLEKHALWLPEEFNNMFPYMKAQNWLFHYRTRAGTGSSLQGLARRALYLSEGHTAYQLFEQNYQLLQYYYRQFWADVRRHAKQQFELLKKGQ